MGSSGVNYEELRVLTLEALKEFGPESNLQTPILINTVEKIATDRGVLFSNEDKDKLVHVISELIIEHVIGWGLNYNNAMPPYMHVTEYGRNVIADTTIQPYDPDGYLANLKTEVPNIDDIIIVYITEALQTLRRNNILSAAVMTGVASERALDLLLDAVIKAITGPGQQEKYEDLRETTRTKEKFDEVKKAIMRIPTTERQKIDENLESDLDGIFNLIRITRNDAGHPTGKIPRRDTVFVNLRLFVPYCKCVYGLIDYLKSNNI